jgi:23S rRNA pseudouridine2605 synthase
MTDATKLERLHKFLARSGAASRRDCEDLIRQGRVSVDGSVVRSMGVQIDPEHQEVRLDGERVHCEPPVTWIVYKPVGVVCTTDDQFGRRNVTSLVRHHSKRPLFPVGRMEEESEGLIVVTNDGDLAATMLKRGHPLRQTWFLKLRGAVTTQALEDLRKGVWLSDGNSGPIWVQVLRRGPHVTTVLASPALNQHRLLRRAFAKVGLSADRMARIRIGHLTTENLKERGARRLTPAEVQRILQPAEEDQRPSGLKAPPPGGRRAADSMAYRSDDGPAAPQRRGRGGPSDRRASAPSRARPRPRGRSR